VGKFDLVEYGGELLFGELLCGFDIFIEGGAETGQLGNSELSLFDGGGDLGVLATAVEVAVVPGLLQFIHGRKCLGWGELPHFNLAGDFYAQL
jgi:hypothetical protein